MQPFKWLEAENSKCNQGDVMEKNGDTEKQDACSQLCKGVDVPSEEEVEALNALRSIKVKVRDLKKMRTDLSSTKENGNGAGMAKLDEEMARLKKDWDDWEAKRKEAARQRMIILGHEEP